MTNKNYTIAELSDKLCVSTRTIQRYIKALYLKEKNKTIIPYDLAKLIEVRHNRDKKYDTSTTTVVLNENLREKNIEYDIVEGFSTEEYAEFQKRLIEHPILKKELEYHKKASERHQRQVEKIIEVLSQRNLIEGRDKGLI